MKRKTRKSGKKLPMLWDSAMDFEVAIRPMAEAEPEVDAELETKIIMFPLPVFSRKLPKNPPPPLAA